jgi:deazaflavin-dependent oxidoreductase (nitroreductase family)
MTTAIIENDTDADHQFRIDAFSVPETARDVFEAAMNRNLAFLETVPGFLGHSVFEKADGPSNFNIVTLATWESREALQNAGQQVRAYYERIGFDLKATLQRWGVKAEIGSYSTLRKTQSSGAARPTKDRSTRREREREGNAAVIAEFRANKGEVAAPYDDPPPMLLLHTIGAKSGREHIVPMRGTPDGESLYVFASAHGSESNPDWYYNLAANPDIVVEKGTRTIPVRATELFGEERDAIFARQAASFPVYTEYERKLKRTIPVIRMDRRA